VEEEEEEEEERYGVFEVARGDVSEGVVEIVTARHEKQRIEIM